MTPCKHQLSSLSQILSKAHHFHEKITRATDWFLSLIPGFYMQTSNVECVLLQKDTAQCNIQ